MNPQISRSQYIFLITWLILGTGILVLPFTVGQFVTRDGWITALLFLVGGIVMAGVVAAFVRIFPEQSLIEGLHTAFGPRLGRLVSLSMLIWIFVTECIVLREIGLFIGTTVLWNTPEFIITGLFMVPVCFAVYMGLEVMGRMAEIITPLGFGISFALYLLAVQHADFSRLQPVLADGWSPILRSGIVPWAYSAEFLLVLQVRRAVPRRFIVRDLFIAAASIAGTGVIVELTISIVLGPTVTYTAYPVLEVVRSIRLGEFLERLDPLYVMGVVSTTFLKIAFFHYTFSDSIREWCNLRHQRAAVWSAATLVWTGSMFLVRNIAELQHFILHVAFGYFAFTAVFVPLLAVFVQWIRTRAGRSSAP